MTTSRAPGGSVGKQVFTSKDGRQRAYWRAQVTVDGVRRAGRAKTKVAAYAMLATLAQPPEDAQSLGEFLSTWIESVRPPVVGPSTWRQWDSHVRVHLIPKLGHIRLTRLTVMDVDRYLTRTDKAPRTISHHRATLRRALSDAVRFGLVPANVVKSSRSVKMTGTLPPVVMTAPEVRTLLDGTADHRLGPFWQVVATTGMREAEALGLVWSDIDVDGRVIHVRRTLQRVDGHWQRRKPKTPKSIRDIPIPASTVLAVRRQRVYQAKERLATGAGTDDDGLVFLTSKGRPYWPNNMVGELHKATERLGLPRATVHSLRHSYATTLIASGIPIAKVAAILGHSSSRVTETVYAHLIGSDLRDAADVMEAAVGG